MGYGPSLLPRIKPKFTESRAEFAVMIQRPTLALFLAVAPAIPAAGQMSPPAAPAAYFDPLSRTLPAGEYVRRAAAYELFQRQAAQTILKTSRNPEIRKLAQQLLAEHARAAADLRAAAAKSGIRIDAALSTIEFKQMIARLSFASADARDALYLSQQRAMHERMMTVHRDYATSGDQPALKEAAARLAAIEQAHLESIKTAGTGAPLAVSVPAGPKP